MTLWSPISTAPRDRPIIVFAREYEGLPPMVLICQWHEDAGFCIDELRTPTLWCEIPGGVDQISQLGALIQAAHSYWIAIGAPGAVGEKGDVF